jgi:hypothetical protein
VALFRRAARGTVLEIREENPVYDEILKEKENYTDEEKERDSAGAKALTQKAIDEIAKKDNYFNVFLKGISRARPRGYPGKDREIRKRGTL